MIATERPVHECVVPIELPASRRPTPTWHHAPVVEHRPHHDRYRYLRLHAPAVARAGLAGQFVMLTAARDGELGPVLPRPMAIYRRDTAAGTLDVCYAVKGDGTRKLATFRPGERMLVVGPLGQGFALDPGTTRVLLVGRGIGTCSLTTIAQDCAATGVEVLAVASGPTAETVIGGKFYRTCGAAWIHEVSDAEGTSEVGRLRERLISELDARPPQQIMTCGSQRLARLCRDLADRWRADVQVSLEAHMACGLGYCHGCATGVRGGPSESPLICSDGPVFRLGHPEART